MSSSLFSITCPSSVCSVRLFRQLPLLSLFRGGEERHCLKPTEEKNSKIRQQHERWDDRTWTWTWKREVKSLWDRVSEEARSGVNSLRGHRGCAVSVQIWFPKKELSQINIILIIFININKYYNKNNIYPLVMQTSSPTTHDGSKGGKVTYLKTWPGFVPRP